MHERINKKMRTTIKERERERETIYRDSDIGKDGRKERQAGMKTATTNEAKQVECRND